MGAQQRVAVLSLDTMAKQAAKRADLSTDVYRQLPTLTDDPTIIAKDGDNSLIFAQPVANLWTVAVVKRTASGKGLFVTSVRQQYASMLPRLLKGTEIIRDQR